MVLISCPGRTITSIIHLQGKIRLRVRWMSLKGGYPIGGAGSRVGLTSSPQPDIGGIKFRIM